MNGKSAAAYPKLRTLDIRTHDQNGRSYIMLRDPLQLSENTVLVPQPLAAVLAFCDGSTSANGMATAFAEHYGFPLGQQLVDQLLAALDNAYLLDNARALAAERAVREEYRAASQRPPNLAGRSYPAEPDELHAMLEEYRASARGQANGAATPPAVSYLDGEQFIAGLLSPHIDYMRGGVVYAQVWEAAAAAAQAADLVVLLGTDHYGSDPFTLTRQHYATPYGVLPTALDVVDQLAATIGEEAAYAGELRHRGEHSLELVAVWLHHLRAGQPVELVPMLVGGFHRYWHKGQDPANDAKLERVLATLAQVTAGRRVLVVASGDLAHVGPAFGQEALDAPTRTRVKAADDALLRAMTAGDASCFYATVAAAQDEYNVCGVAPIYMTMQLLQRTLGKINGRAAGYATCPADDENTSAVTVGGVVFVGAK